MSLPLILRTFHWRNFRWAFHRRNFRWSHSYVDLLTGDRPQEAELHCDRPREILPLEASLPLERLRSLPLKASLPLEEQLHWREPSMEKAHPGRRSLGGEPTSGSGTSREEEPSRER
jgi:hypothetical protein